MCGGVWPEREVSRKATPVALCFCLLARAAHALPAWSDTPANLVKHYAGASGSPPASASHASANLPGYHVTWSITADRGGEIVVGVEAPTTGWVGFGLSEAAAMRGADIMMGHVEAATAQAVVGDYHSSANGKPVRDGCQDWSVLHGEENGRSTLLIVSRKLITSDPNDRPILVGALRKTGLLLAYGTGDSPDSYAYHGVNRTKIYVDLQSGADESQASWSAAKQAQPDLSFIELKANEAWDPAALGPSPANTFQGPVPGGQPIPADTTTYWEYCFSDGSLVHDSSPQGAARPLRPSSGASWNRSLTMVAFESVSDGSPANIHHFVLNAYDTDRCQTGGTEGIIWVGGIGFYEDLPAGIGFAFSRVRSFRLQVHYNNPTGASGLRDNSGVRIWLSAAAPTHYAGTLALGDGPLALEGEILPAGRSFYSFTCSSAVTSAWPTDITVFGSMLHMHQQGDAMYTEIKDGGGGGHHPDGGGSNQQVVRRANAVQYFDFAWQDPTPVEPYTIKKGDTTTTRCYFNNVVGTAAKPLKFGRGSDEEMCIDFLWYYPYSAALQHYGCALDENGTIPAAATSSEDFRTFGVDAGTASDPRCDAAATTTVTLATVGGGGGGGGGGAGAGGGGSVLVGDGALKMSVTVSAANRACGTLGGAGLLLVSFAALALACAG